MIVTKMGQEVVLNGYDEKREIYLGINNKGELGEWLLSWLRPSPELDEKIKELKK